MSDILTAIKVEELIKRFGDLTAVNQISFKVDEGELFGFLGPNGAGKTTTVRMLTGILKPDSGNIKILGKSFKKQTSSLKEEIGVVPEIANAYNDLTGWQNMMLNGELYGVPKKERKTKGKNLLKEFGIYDRKNSKVKNYSKGMKQRLMLGMALINDPSILFLDEPISGLDVQSQQLIRDKIKELKNQGKTIFLTTHNLLEADRLCDTVGIINNGEIIAINSPENLKTTIESSKSVLVSFSANPDNDVIRDLGEVEYIVEEGDKIRIFSSNPGLLVKKLVNLANNNDLEIRTMKTLGPSLEEVFTELTGGSK